MRNRSSKLPRRRLLQMGTSAAAWLFWGAMGCGPTPSDQTPPPVTRTSLSVMEPAAQADAEIEEETPTSLIRIPLLSLPNTFDPALFENPSAFVLGFTLYDSLVWIDRTLTPQPMLAAHWESSQNGRLWTFQLRRDVTFHHGAPFTAADVVYTLTRLLDPKLQSSMEPVLNFIKEVKALDDYTVRFLLHTPIADLPLLLGTPQTSIIPHDYALPQLLNRPVGTGPFRFDELVPGEHLTLVRNADYWEAERITIDELTYIRIDSFPAQVRALVQDEVDLLLDIDVDVIEQLNENPDTVVMEKPSGRYQNLAMRVNGPPFSDNRVRQALKACIDRTVLQQIWQGRSEMGNDHPIAPISPFFTDLPATPPDLAKARQLLADAGYPTGLQLQLLTADAAPGMVKLAYAVQTMALPAGIAIEVIEIKVPSDIYFIDYWGRAPFYVSNWEFRPSIYETFAIAYHSKSAWNETGWSSPALDTILDDARSALDPVRRKELYKAAEQLLIEEGAVIVPYFLPVLTAMRTRVQGFTPHPAGWVDLRDVQIT